MNFFSKLSGASFLVALLSFESPALATKSLIIGSCAGFEVPITEDGEVDWIGSVRVLRDNSAVYGEAEATEVLTTLAFGRPLEITQVGELKLKVQALSDEKPIGWVKRNDLLCRDTPLRGDTGLEQKIYIKTETAVQGEKPATVKAFPSPTGDDCLNKCRELSRFNGYFIFANDTKTDRYLLADNYLLDDSTSMIGWINKSNGFIWDTAYGLRPREDLKYPKGHTKVGQERAICIYPSLSDAKAEQNCKPLLGGDRWYSYSDRVPVLGREENFYRVIVPLAGTGISKKGGGNIVIAPEVMGRSNKAINSLENLKNLDIFFLIDGTSSMQPYIDVIRGTKQNNGIIQNIITAFGKNDAFLDTKLRFGFRIYRDTYAGNSGLGEALPFNSTCNVTSSSLVENLDDFSTQISKVQTSMSDAARGDTDYEENSLGGIEQAMDDMLPCPENSKILFVIGDHGYDKDAQRIKGSKIVNIANLAQSMTGNKKLGEKSIVTFFIQTPNTANQAKNPNRYQRAYRKFNEQANQIVSKILDQRSKQELSTFVLTSDDNRLTEKIVKGVQMFGDSRVVNEIIADVQGGTPLVDVITRLQGSKEFNNLPGLFWDLVEQGSCKALGSQCKERIYETVLEGYVKDNADASIDIWLKSDDLTRWVSLLSLMQDVRQYGGKEQRLAFVQALVDTLQNVIGKPLYEDTNETLKDYLQRKGGLPVRDNSPLIKYSLSSLMDPSQVPNCEVLRLASWVQNAKQMLAIASKGDRRPVFNTENYPGECPGGKDIPFIDGDIGQRPLGTDDMNYGHSFQKAKIFWIPKNFLP